MAEGRISVVGGLVPKFHRFDAKLGRQPRQIFPTSGSIFRILGKQILIIAKVLKIRPSRREPLRRRVNRLRPLLQRLFRR